MWQLIGGLVVTFSLCFLYVDSTLRGCLFIYFINLLHLDVLLLYIFCVLICRLSYILLCLCVALDDISAHCLTACCMNTLLLLDCMLLVDVGYTCIPLCPTP